MKLFYKSESKKDKIIEELDKKDKIEKIIEELENVKPCKFHY